MTFSAYLQKPFNSNTNSKKKNQKKLIVIGA